MRKSVIGIGAAVVVAAGTALSAGVMAHASTTPATNHVTPQVKLVTAMGSGCPDGIAGVKVAYNDGIELSFSEMLSVKANNSTSPVSSQENCQLGLQVSVPNGTTYAVSAIKTNASANLSRGATATVRQTAYVQGVSSTSDAEKTIAGPVYGDVEVVNTMSGSQSFAPCNAERNLNVNTRVVLDSNDASPATNRVAITKDMKISLSFRSC